MKFFYLSAGVLLALGIFLLLCDLAGVPTRRLSSSVRKVLKGKRQPQGDVFAGLTDWLAKLLSKHLPFSVDRIERVQQSLDSAGITVPAKLYLSGCIAQAVLFFFIAVLASILVRPLVVFAFVGPVWVYDAEKKKVNRLTKEAKQEIEHELPGFVHTILSELAGSRDVLRMMKEYIPTAGPVLGKELAITVADMESGTYETALTRMGTRVNSSAMNDVVRGLVDAVRGNEVATYFQMLSYDLKQLELKNMKLKAQRRVPKLNACAMVLLGSIVMLFLGVLSVYIFANMGPLY